MAKITIEYNGEETNDAILAMNVSKLLSALYELENFRQDLYKSRTDCERILYNKNKNIVPSKEFLEEEAKKYFNCEENDWNNYKAYIKEDDLINKLDNILCDIKQFLI